LTTIGSGIHDLSFAPEHNPPLTLQRAQLQQLQARELQAREQQSTASADQQSNQADPARQRRRVGAGEANDNQQQRRASNRARPIEPEAGRRAEDNQKSQGPAANRRATDQARHRPDPGPGTTNIPGLPAAGFLAQFIAQEIAPEENFQGSPDSAGRTARAFSDATARYQKNSNLSDPAAPLAKELDRV
jgi:hypothetical protein